MSQLLITDLDNTLYNWIDYFAPSFRGMVHAIAREMKVSEQELYDGFKEVYKSRESLEYSFSIQELPFINRYSSEEIEKFVNLGKIVFSRVRDSNLKIYDGVKETLEELTNRGVFIVAVTNAPIYHGEARLKQLRIDKYFWGIAGWEGHQIPDDAYTEKISHKSQEGKYQSRYIQKRWGYHKNDIKPNPNSYLEILNELKISHKSTYVIGDSMLKDLIPANEIGAKSIWAKYGTHFRKDNFETILKITHWEENTVKSAYDEKSFEPDYTVNNSFSELLEIIPDPRLKLF